MVHLSTLPNFQFNFIPIDIQENDTICLKPPKIAGEICNGKEICNAFSELNDPLDQRDRFEAQKTLSSRGDAGIGTAMDWHVPIYTSHCLR